MYSRRVNAITDVLDHIHYNIATFAADGTTPLFLELFKCRLKKYLEGTGHPPHPFIESSGLANEYEIDCDRNDSVLRAQHFLLACTESDLLPVDDNFKIKVSTLVFFMAHYSCCLHQFNIIGLDLDSELVRLILDIA